MLTFWAYIIWTAFIGSGLMRVITYEGGTWRTPFSFDHGYVLVWDDPLDDAIAHSQTIALYGPDGHKLYATSLTSASGVQAWAVSGSIDVDGTVAAVYYDRANSQTRGIALLDPKGTVVSFINPTPYFPVHLCFAEDGSIWSNGSWTTGSGAFLPLSEVSSLNDASYRRPFDSLIGGWTIRAAKDRIASA